MKKIIDERQELKMMKVERTGFWIMWGVLLLSLLVQSLFSRGRSKADCRRKYFISGRMSDRCDRLCEERALGI